MRDGKKKREKRHVRMRILSCMSLFFFFLFGGGISCMHVWWHSRDTGWHGYMVVTKMLNCSMLRIMILNCWKDWMAA